MFLFDIALPPALREVPFGTRVYVRFQLDWEPLGWQIEATAVDLDPVAPEWGRSPYLDARLTGELRLADALRQLYVLLPVLDDAKHYWVSDDEVDKLIRAGEGWLAGHP